MRRALVLAGGAIGLSIFGVGLVAGADDAGDDGSEWSRVVDEARAQMESATFEGVVVVEWRDAAGKQSAEMQVSQRDGVVEVAKDGRTVTGDASSVLLDGEAWTTLAPAAGTGPPSLTSGKYQIASGDGPEIAGHGTTRYTALREGRPVERVYVHEDSGLVLRREVLDRDGDVVRAVAFERVDDLPEVAPTPSTDPRRGGPVPVDDLDEPFRDPARAGEGFRLLGRWQHHDDLAQLFYSDGVFSVSMYQQPGRLQWDRLPRGGVDAEVSGQPARRYGLPVGEAWVFERGGVVYTCVGDAPAEDIAAVAGQVSQPDESRVERLAEMVVGPFRW